VGGGRGEVTRISFADYAAQDAVNFSTLKAIDKSPLHYQHAVKFGREDNTGLLKGRATHTAVFEPDEFMRKYAVYKGKRRGTKEWYLFAALHHREDIIKLDEYEQALSIRDAVRRHPVAGPLLARGNAEESITWVDPDTGIKCKARLDWYNESALIDLKGTASTDARHFGAFAARQRYHVQAAWYSDGLMLSKGIRPPVKLIAAEFNPPFDVAVFPLSEDDLFVGTETYQGWLKKVAECRESGVWPGRFPDEEPLVLPAYIFGEDGTEELTAQVVGEEHAEVF
jgi:PDDEXK-like domain of unknown function (DUF3799)